MEISPLIFMESISVEDYDIFYGIPWKSLPRRIRTTISIEFHGNFFIEFSIEFHGKVPCNSIETMPSIIPWISRAFHGIHRN